MYYMHGDKKGAPAPLHRSDPNLYSFPCDSRHKSVTFYLTVAEVI